MVIAKAVGMHDSQIANICAGSTTRMDRDCVAAILSLKPQDLYRAAEGKDWVSGIGAMRRMRALQTLGHPWEDIYPYRSTAMRLLSGRSLKIHAVTHHEIASRYAELITVPGVSNRVRQKAIREGWVGPLHWSSESIDDLFAEPETDIADLDSKALLIDRVEDGLNVGLSLQKIATMLEVNTESLKDRLRRLDRVDLIRESV